MAIHRRDRTFQKIINDIEVETIPVDYIQNVTCTLNDGSEIYLENEQDFAATAGTDLEKMIKTLPYFEMISDLKIRINFEKVEQEVVRQVDQIFKRANDPSNSSM